MGLGKDRGALMLCCGEVEGKYRVNEVIKLRVKK